jgi:hypothetical protein
MSPTKRKARDLVKPPGFFDKVIAGTRASVEDEVKTGIAAVMTPVPNECLRIAMAHYSAGDGIPECQHWLGQAVDYRMEIFKKRDYQLGGWGALIENLETLAAASLVGRGPELVDAYRRCQLQHQPVPRIHGLMDQAFAVFKAEPVEQVKAEMDDLRKNGKELATLAPLFKAVADRSAAGFEKALTAFVLECWTKEVKGSERDAEYSGKWSILAAAVSKIMGGVPKLSKEALPYVPVELAGS